MYGVLGGQCRNGRFGAALVVVGVMLGGCSSPSLPSMPSLSSLMGNNSSGSPAANANASAAYTPPADFECPTVGIRQGASTLAVSTNPAEQSALNMRYQVGIAQTARECKVTGNTLTMKVGIQGRVVLGPAGGPGQLDVPLRFAVVQEGVEPKTIVSRLQRVHVTVPDGSSNVLFTHVEEDLTFPMPKGGDIDAYIVYVGFDPLGAREIDRKKPAPRPARPGRTG
jgi:hypothetical protein